MVKVEFYIPVLSVTKIVKWNCHEDDSIVDRYYMIMGRDLLTKLGTDLFFLQKP